MSFRKIASWLLLGSTLATASVATTGSHTDKITPKVFIVSMFEPEAQAWWHIREFDLLAHNITVPGLSPLYPDVHCTEDYEICQLITGESEINAATTVTSVAFSPLFNLTQTYFFIAGIAGVNPERATLGSATFARYAVQVALQYEIDIRELPSSYSTGYIPLGADYPNQYPTNIYGTEVFEVNAELRRMRWDWRATAISLTRPLPRHTVPIMPPPVGGTRPPRWGPPSWSATLPRPMSHYSGDILGNTFDNTTKLLTNGTGEYCAKALLRSSTRNLTDFSRIIVMRTASDFDRPYPGSSTTYNLLYADAGGFEPALANIYNAGIHVVQGIIKGWKTTFAEGVEARNYVGDIFGTLGGQPDFGPGRTAALADSGAFKKRSLSPRLRRRS
ncbi:hypothetical protein N7470_008009 [Penicillium chermesinum]|nr:hypothetical protein N7470_008009 [Penicillium chermesinum]